MSQVRFKSVEKRFAETIVIKKLDLTIYDGEFFTFVGPSGCGKSTILNMIAGLEPVSKGEILFDNKIVNNLSPKERDIAMVFQSYALYPHMTIYQNLAFPLMMKRFNKELIDKEVKRIASLIGLEALLQKKPKELSGGQRQRVALGRAIIRRPKVFLMDEPLSNLDARLRIDMRTELKKLHHELKITTIYVTHDQAEALSLSDRIAVLNQGKIQQCGTPFEVYSKPANIFVGSFIGSPSMNFINCSVKNLYPFQINCNGIILSPILEKTVKHSSVIIGIRPEDINVSNEKTDNSIEVRISLIEPAGSVNWVDFIWGDIQLKGNAHVDVDIKEGMKAFIKFPINKIIIFDRESGERV